MDAPGLKHRVNARTAVNLAVFPKNLWDFGCKLGIFSAMLGSLPVFQA
jgi:hypothetical protein